MTLTRRAAVLLVCFCLATLATTGQAMPQAKASDSDLSRRVSALEEQQKQIIQQLDSISRMLEPKSPQSSSAPPTSIKIQSEPFIGERKARVAILEFADFECPYCGQFAHDTYPQLVENYVKTGKVVFFYHDFPLSEHPYADQAAEAAQCAAEQGKYWEMHDDLFAHQAQPPERTISADAQVLGIDAAKMKDCISRGRYAEAIQKSAQDARKMGVRATPSFLLGIMDSDGHDLRVLRALRGAYTYDAFKVALDDVLAQSSADKSDNK
jgi:protein-disulfide isomerase